MILFKLKKYLLLCLCTVIVFSAFFGKHHAEPHFARVLPSDYDVVMTHITSKKFDATGNLVSQAQAIEARHDPITNKDFYTQPHLHYYPKFQPSWQLSATKGSANVKQNYILFEKNVTISQNGSKQQLPMQIQTDHLKYNLKAQTALTQDKIILNQNNSQFRSDGACINFKTHRVKLFSKIEAFYEE